MISNEKTCSQCGQLFSRDTRNTYAYWSRAKYCSQTCAGLAHSATATAERKPLAEMFAKYVVKAGGCWPWSGLQDKDGYGLFMYARKSYRAHKLALELDGRPVPKGMYACHHCDNPICVNPAHLYPGTPSQNVSDMLRRGRCNYQKTAKLSVDQVIAIRGTAGTNAAIGNAYNVSPSLISMIKTRRIWRHLP